MSAEKDKPKQRMKVSCSLLFVLFVLTAGAVAGALALGWVTVQRGNDRITIEIYTSKARADTEKAVEEGKEAVKKTGKAMQDAGKKLENIDGGDENKKSDQESNDDSNANASKPDSPSTNENSSESN